MREYLDRKVDYETDKQVTSAFDEVSFWSSHFGQLLLSHVALRAGQVVLDVACGTGFPLFELAHRLGNRSWCVGVDLWKAALERARLKSEVYQPLRVGLACGDASQLPFRQESFDLIVSNLGLNNLMNPRAALIECRRVSKRGGRLAITTNVRGHMREFYTEFRNVLRDCEDPAAMSRLEQDEAHRGTKASVCGDIEAVGFEVEKTVEAEFQMRFADGTALLSHFLSIVGFLPAWKQVAGPTEERATFADLEHRLNERAAREGELRVTIPMLFVEAVRK